MFAKMVYHGFRSIIVNGDKVHYTLNVGEEVTIKLKSIESTGNELVWINSENCKSTEYIGSESKDTFNELMGLVGAGGLEYWTFKCISTGTDTIKIAYVQSLNDILIEEDGELPASYPTEADIQVIFDCK